MLTGEGFDPPAPMPGWGVLDRPADQAPADGQGPRPVVAILYYRAHQWRGTPASCTRSPTRSTAAGGRPLPVFCSSLRTAEPALIDTLRAADAIVVTVLAAGGLVPAAAGAGGADEEWDVGALARAGRADPAGPVPDLLPRPVGRQRRGADPADAATQVAIPEFDGRLITVPFSFKETGPDGLTSYVPDPERDRAGGRASPCGTRCCGTFRRGSGGSRSMLSAYPTKHARIGNAVGLDTPASVVALLAAMRDAGYDIGGRRAARRRPTGTATRSSTRSSPPGGRTRTGSPPSSSRATRSGSARRTTGRGSPPSTPGLRDAVIGHWGDAAWRAVRRPQPAIRTVRSSWPRCARATSWCSCSRRAGSARTRSRSTTTPTCRRATTTWRPTAGWRDGLRRARRRARRQARQPGVAAGQDRRACPPPAARTRRSATSRSIYPFLVNDPGEGTQAKRRAHATLIDHLVPPMARAETYGDIARLEQLMDEHAQIAALDPAKLPGHPGADLDADPGRQARPRPGTRRAPARRRVRRLPAARRRLALRDQGRPDPRRAARPRRARRRARPGSNLVLAILRARQMWGGRAQALPGLREALGLRRALRRPRGGRRRRGAGPVARRGRWRRPAGSPPPSPTSLAGVPQRRARDRGGRAAGRDVLAFAATEVVPRLAATGDEITGTLHALDGGFVPAGPSGSPLRGLVNVLPTGRNFYSVDPRPCRPGWPGRPARRWPTPCSQRYLTDTGELPAVGRPVGVGHRRHAHLRRRRRRRCSPCSASGRSGTRRPAGSAGSQPIPLAELGRPRIDVTVRISGFFRDAFPHVVTMLDDAVRLVAALDEPVEQNYVRAHARADLAVHGDERRATTRIFGSKPGAYGAGLLPLIDARNWRDDADLAEVYAAWGGFAYGRGPGRQGGPRGHGDRPTAGSRWPRTTPTRREHDIADSDDYFQYHGGMIATVRALTGQRPARLLRRLHPPRHRPHPVARRGDRPGLPRPGGQPALGRGDAAARLQGRLRAGRHGRLPVRLRRHRRRRRGLDVRQARPGLRPRRGDAGVLRPVQPVGAARHRRTPP